MPLRERVREAVRRTKATLRALADATAATYDPVPHEISDAYVAEIDALVERAARFHEMRAPEHYRATSCLIDIWPHYKQLRQGAKP
jgi:hypothetical protein